MRIQLGFSPSKPHAQLPIVVQLDCDNVVDDRLAIALFKPSASIHAESVISVPHGATHSKLQLVPKMAGMYEIRLLNEDDGQVIFRTDLIRVRLPDFVVMGVGRFGSLFGCKSISMGVVALPKRVDTAMDAVESLQLLAAMRHQHDIIAIGNVSDVFRRRLLGCEWVHQSFFHVEMCDFLGDVPTRNLFILSKYPYHDAAFREVDGLQLLIISFTNRDGMLVQFAVAAVADHVVGADENMQNFLDASLGPDAIISLPGERSRKNLANFVSEKFEVFKAGDSLCLMRQQQTPLVHIDEMMRHAFEQLGKEDIVYSSVAITLLPQETAANSTSESLGMSSNSNNSNNIAPKDDTITKTPRVPLSFKEQMQKAIVGLEGKRDRELAVLHVMMRTETVKRNEEEGKALQAAEDKKMLALMEIEAKLKVQLASFKPSPQLMLLQKRLKGFGPRSAFSSPSSGNVSFDPNNPSAALSDDIETALRQTCVTLESQERAAHEERFVNLAEENRGIILNQHEQQLANIKEKYANMTHLSAGSHERAARDIELRFQKAVEQVRVRQDQRAKSIEGNLMLKGKKPAGTKPKKADDRSWKTWNFVGRKKMDTPGIETASLDQVMIGSSIEQSPKVATPTKAMTATTPISPKQPRLAAVDSEVLFQDAARALKGTVATSLELSSTSNKAERPKPVECLFSPPPDVASPSTLLHSGDASFTALAAAGLTGDKFQGSTTIAMITETLVSSASLPCDQAWQPSTSPRQDDAISLPEADGTVLEMMLMCMTQVQQQRHVTGHVDVLPPPWLTNILTGAAATTFEMLLLADYLQVEEIVGWVAHIAAASISVPINEAQLSVLLSLPPVVMTQVIAASSASVALSAATHPAIGPAFQHSSHALDVLAETLALTIESTVITAGLEWTQTSWMQSDAANALTTLSLIPSQIVDAVCNTKRPLALLLLSVVKLVNEGIVPHSSLWRDVYAQTADAFFAAQEDAITGVSTLEDVSPPQLAGYRTQDTLQLPLFHKHWQMFCDVLRFIASLPLVTRTPLGRVLQTDVAVHAEWPVPGAFLGILQVFGCGDAINMLLGCVVHTPDLPPTNYLDLWGCSKASAEAIIAVIRKLPALSRIDLNGVTHVSDAVLQTIGNRGEILCELHLGGCPNITDNGISSLVAALEHTTIVTPRTSLPSQMYGNKNSPTTSLPGLPAPALRRLALNSCRNLTNKSLEKIGETVIGLEDLCIFGCYRMTDDGLISFAVSGCLLKRLNTSGCYKITTVGIRYLLNSNPSLLIYNKPEAFYNHTSVSSP